MRMNSYLNVITMPPLFIGRRCSKRGIALLEALSLVKFCVSHAPLWRWHTIDIAKTGSLHRMAGAYIICVHKLTLYVSFKAALVPSSVRASRTELSTWLPLVSFEILSFSSVLAILSWFYRFCWPKNAHFDLSARIDSKQHISRFFSSFEDNQMLPSVIYLTK